jgi:glycosyltransferase involved in cell wall biosynthesis
MDGGSTDNSVDIIKKFDKLLKSGSWKIHCHGITLRWISEKDRGQTHAINKGLELAKGDIVSYINSDDMFIQGAFSTIANYFQMNSQTDFLYGDGDVINEEGKIQWEWLSRPYNYKLLKSYHFLWNDFTNYIMQQAAFWRRRVIDKIGLFDESFHYAMDIEYWLRIGRNGLKAVHIPIKLGMFRMIQGTKSLSSPTIFWPDSLKYLDATMERAQWSHSSDIIIIMKDLIPLIPM